MKTIDQNLKFETLAIHAGQTPDPSTGAIMTPIFQTSTYVQDAPGVHKGFEYARTQNPTRFALEANLAALEKASYGLCFSSGCGAMMTVLHTLKKGDHVICCDNVYGGTYRLLTKVFPSFGVEVDFVDLTDSNAILPKFKSNTKLVWLETPTNPLLKLIDIETIAAHAKKRGALTLVDNTFMSPYFQNPLLLGADLVVHSTTKYIGGHSDVVGGFVGTNNKTLFDELKYLQNTLGAIPGPMDCFLSLRGTKTLHVRMERHQQNAMALAQWLEKHPKIDRVIYPGLKSHAQHELARKQARGFGGMISFYLKSDLAGAKAFLSKVNLIACAESLGGVESLIEHPAIMTHGSIPAEVRESLGIRDGFIRMSVGIENCDDLIADLDRALKVLP